MDTQDYNNISSIIIDFLKNKKVTISFPTGEGFVRIYSVENERTTSTVVGVAPIENRTYRLRLIKSTVSKNRIYHISSIYKVSLVNDKWKYELLSSVLREE